MSGLSAGVPGLPQSVLLGSPVNILKTGKVGLEAHEGEGGDRASDRVTGDDHRGLAGSLRINSDDHM